MAISLSKGGNVSLSKESPGLDEVMVGLGWDVRATDGQDFDLDASAFLLKGDGKVRSDGDFCFYNNKDIGGAVVHQGDNRTGEGDGDDEQIKIVLSKVPADVEKVAVAVTIHDGESRGQTFGQVSNAFIRLVDNKTGTEIVRYDLAEDASVETALILGEVYRNAGEWKFRAVGQGFKGGLGPLASNFGVNIG
ncbi:MULTISPECIES: TerD family protein [unclassified Sphingopyxis]|uniref:TerD family protein n=1 Tax=unclassified Sphingopyxis TaxID=2614943 RepID=UPI0007378419|nr:MULTISPECIES: TerD family protein [unclassified Sphingopyxis]KTE40076.1 chemical-damaging agent resistance protein C [Sphingopyxis sp. HIX]KTE86018.1 chemical-damaging agent resistance protein C [Sphingopyxis sp. HXXIV]